MCRLTHLMFVCTTTLATAGVVQTFPSGQVVPSRSNLPLEVVSLIVRKGNRVRALLANFGSAAREVDLGSLPTPAHVSLIGSTVTARVPPRNEKLHLILPAQSVTQVDWRIG